jgi:hypothetical protein
MKISEFKKEIVATIFLITISFNVYFWFDTTYAKEETARDTIRQVQMLEVRLDKKILRDNRDDIQSRIWDLEKYYSCYGYEECMNILRGAIRDEYKKLHLDLKFIEEEIDEAGD